MTAAPGIFTLKHRQGSWSEQSLTDSGVQRRRLETPPAAQVALKRPMCPERTHAAGGAGGTACRSWSQGKGQPETQAGHPWGYFTADTTLGSLPIPRLKLTGPPVELELCRS